LVYSLIIGVAMGSLIKDIINGFIILSIGRALHGLTKAMGTKAANAHRVGLMSYKSFTKKLTH